MAPVYFIHALVQLQTVNCFSKFCQSRGGAELQRRGDYDHRTLSMVVRGLITNLTERCNRVNTEEY